jgi:hypothetical protein
LVIPHESNNYLLFWVGCAGACNETFAMFEQLVIGGVTSFVQLQYITFIVLSLFIIRPQHFSSLQSLKHLLRKLLNSPEVLTVSLAVSKAP